MFSSIETEPCGAASIGQAHKAVTLNGDQVVLKVQYPGAKETFTADLRCIATIVALAQPDATQAFEEFAR